MVRRIGDVLIAVAVVGFVIAFFHVTTHDVPSTCYGADCFSGENRWIIAFPGTIFLFVGGVMMAAFGSRGYGNTHGPKSFADVDSGKYAPRPDRPDATGHVRTSTWSRAWRNAYGYTGAGEIGLGLLFIIANANNPEEMSGGYLTGGLLSAIGVVFLWAGWKAAKKDRLHEDGVEGTARILSITQTGAYMSRNPYVIFDLEVVVPGHPAYEVKHREIVPLVLLGRLATGTSLPVRVDRDNPSHLIVEWERA